MQHHSFIFLLCCKDFLHVNLRHCPLEEDISELCTPKYKKLPAPPGQPTARHNLELTGLRGIPVQEAFSAVVCCPAGF